MGSAKVHVKKMAIDMEIDVSEQPGTQMISISSFPDPSSPRSLPYSSHFSNPPLFHSLSNKFKLKSSPSLTPPSTKTSSSTETRKPSHILLESPLTTLNMEKVLPSPPTTSPRCLSSDTSTTRTLKLHPNIPQFPSQSERPEDKLVKVIS